MKAKICILGDFGNYTRFIIGELIQHDIVFDFITINKEIPIKTANVIEKIIIVLYNHIILFNSFTYKSLPKSSMFFWEKFLGEKIFRKSKLYKELTSKYKKYNNDILKSYQVFNCSYINDIEVYDFLKKQNYKIGILGGVGIVKQSIIDCFDICINAHPAPLPQCRGGGAIENTFLYDLAPASSVHIVTKDIDAGDIIEIRNIKIDKYDNYFSIETKLKIEGAVLLAETAKKLLNNNKINYKPNNGKLHFFKDLNLNIQKKAHKKLRVFIKSIK